MLKSLFRYDFRAVVRHWWIALLTVAALTCMGGVCIRVLDSDRELPEAVRALAMIGMILTMLGFFAVYLVGVISVFVRFYRNFFTDEGYLTFTLPVSRVQLLNSKLIMSVGVLCVSAVVIFLGIMGMMAIGLGDKLFNQAFWEGWTEFWSLGMEGLGVYLPLYMLELAALAVLAMVFFCLLVFVCITFACIITKKAKVLAAIGIYYVANSVISFGTQILYLFTLPNILMWLTDVPEEQIKSGLVLLLLGLGLFIAVACALLYCLEHWMLDRKLNLH